MVDKPVPQRRKFKKKPKSRFGLWVALLILVILAFYAGALELSRPHVSGDTLNYTAFVDAQGKGRIHSATLLDLDNYMVGSYTREDGTEAQFNTPLTAKTDRGDLLNAMAGAHVPTTIDPQSGKAVVSLATYILPGLAIILLLIYFIVSYRRGSGLFAVKSGARKVESEEAKVSFADVAGQGQAISELKEIGQFLSDPARFTDVGASIPKGILLYGPPGCGKTLLAKALAAEEGASFYSISGSDFIEIYVGVGAARVRDLFKEARENAPSILFIDELDSVGRRRGGGTGGTMGSHPEQEQALNQILTEMDGFSTSDGIIVIGATNRPDVLDPALLRPGRFDRSIGLERPDEEGRLQILQLHARKKRLTDDADLRRIAQRAVGMNGADLANVMNEAALLAARSSKPSISQVELDQAIQRILEAPSRQRRLAMRDRSFGRKTTAEADRVTFADIAGQDAAVREMREIEQILTEPERYAALGAEAPKGILLFGPPGSGKTLLAKALAGEANAAFFSVTATEFVEVFVGEGAARVRDLFAEARSMPPAIIFIDELEAIGRRRGGGAAASGSGGGQEQEQALNQILTEMDGFTASTGLIVIGSTNRPDALDPALLRPGRFDRSVGLERPDEKGRLQILQLHATEKVLDPGADLAVIARRAIGLNGADLANIVNEAALLAVRAEKAAVSQVELEEALRRVLEAPDRQRRLSMRARSFGRSATAAEERVTFADLAGVDDAIEELREFRDYLIEPERFEAMGARIPRGVLLVGPPGCGKTMLAKAVAGETNAAFFSVAASEFVEVFVGEGAGRVRDLFAEARSMAPAILFVDEIDALGGHRGAHSGQEHDQTLNQFLVELDGFSSRSGLIIMAATNRADRLDSALIRPGRFDRQVTIQLPDRAGRRAILDLHASGKNLDPQLDLNAIAAITQGMSGADLANLMNEAALLATRRGATALTMALVDEALERAVLGASSRGNLMSDEEKRATAYHEGGHALVTRALSGAGTLHRVTIVGRGHTLGASWHRDVGETDRTHYTRSSLIDSMAATLAGRAAEELVLGEPGAGASADLSSASSTARRMVCELGMSPALGQLTYDGSDGGRRAYSEPLAALIDAEIRRLTDEAYALAERVLTASRAALDRLAEALLERESLTGDEVAEIAGPPPEVRPAPVNGSGPKAAPVTAASP